MGHMKNFDIRIRQGGDDAIAAVTELMDCKIYEDVVRELQPWLAQRQWVPVSERLPDEEEEVLAFWPAPSSDDENWIAIAWVFRDDRWRTEEQDVHPPTHWMPLPEPPG